jgi:HSP20 family protein
MKTTDKPIKRSESAEQNVAPTEQTVAYLTPTVDIVENGDAYVLQADMPGVAKEGLEILLENNELALVGHRSSSADADAQYVYRESRPAHFRRVFELDPAIDTDKIEAKMDNGVLTLTLPKSERVKPRKITVSD